MWVVRFCVTFINSEVDNLKFENGFKLYIIKEKIDNIKFSIR